MTRRLLVQPAVDDDIAHAADWYEDQQPGLGIEFIAAMRRTLQAIAERPESFPLDFRYARRARAMRFPYKVYFVLKDDLVSVIAVLHDRQNRDRLRERL